MLADLQGICKFSVESFPSSRGVCRETLLKPARTEMSKGFCAMVSVPV